MATFTWTSATSGDWNTASNWSPATVPNATDADVLINGGSTYTITIAAGASDTVHSIDMELNASQVGGALEVDGTLDFTGGTGSITGALQSVVTVNNGTIINGGTMNPNFQVNGSATFVGTNGIYFNNQLEANAGATARVDAAGGLAELTGNTLFDGVFIGNNGTVDLGGTVTINIGTITGPPLNPAGFTDIILIGTGGVVNEWNGTAYVPVETTLNTIGSRGTVFALNRDYTTTQTLTIDGGTMFLSADTLTSGGPITVKNGGTLVGNSSVITNAIVDNSTIQVGTGVLLLQGNVSGTGILNFDPTGQGTLEIAGTTANSISMLGTDTLQLDAPSSFTGTVSAVASDKFILQGITADNAVLNGTTLVVNSGTTPVYSMQLAGNFTGDTFAVSTTSGGVEVDIVCFARGTRIRTPKGEVPVEQLEVGQKVLTASGKTVPIKWIGRRHVDCRRHPEPWRVWPVRIAAGAFGRGLPRRDLLVSPQHGIYDEGVLVPARFLINDTTIAQEPVGQVEYFHIELPNHDLLLSEGLATESYLENGDRNSFENGGGALVLHPDFSRWSWDARSCAELVVTGPQLQAIRAKLKRHAERLSEPRVASRGRTTRSAERRLSA